MLSFEERMAMLDAVLETHTSESLFAELSKFPAYGPSLASCSVEVSEKIRVIEPSNVQVAVLDDIVFSSEVEYSEAA